MCYASADYVGHNMTDGCYTFTCLVIIVKNHISYFILHILITFFCHILINQLQPIIEHFIEKKKCINILERIWN